VVDAASIRAAFAEAASGGATGTCSLHAAIKVTPTIAAAARARAERVLDEPRHGKDARHRTERDDKLLVRDLQLPGFGSDAHGPPRLVELEHVAENELGAPAHLPEWDDAVPRLDRSGSRFRQQRRVQHEVLSTDDRRAVAPEQPGDVAAGETATEDERSTACLPGSHAWCLSTAGWRTVGSRLRIESRYGQY
jgi:hypothetical protein